MPIGTINELRTRLLGKTIGFVPTMGALHQGHASLIEAAARGGYDEIVVSIFVNPLQFGPNEDLAAYPRSLERDLDLAQKSGATIVFAPNAHEMYPEGKVKTTVLVQELSNTLEGELRPGHFDGVCTVVSKLFNIVGPCHAYFGEKDFQQLTIVTKMVADLSIPVVVHACPTLRQPSGLAMSSRNAYLTPEQRLQAGVIYQSLMLGAKMIEEGERDSTTLEKAMGDLIVGCDLVDGLDYVRVIDPLTLARVDNVDNDVRIVVAAKVGTTRLIDNLVVPIKPH